MKKVVVIVGIITAMACNNSNTSQHAGDTGAAERKASDSVAEEMHDPTKKLTPHEEAQAPPPVAAVYSGALPCESCIELSVRLTLRTDSTYQKDSQYLGGSGGKRGTSQADTGIWMMRGDTLMLESKKTNEKYLKSERQLSLIDAKEKGKQAGSYILKQTN